eukprot:TRINITY_DN17374_c0_g1_i2.p1 TRINITY_DN17374_c0_g1~~TRINITY_DN17374_c0_g1_i2.p1  ORF type:complete len:172 (+),score=37.84 TRINITY_DN17374_c0_g1_i2:88-603(+)
MKEWPGTLKAAAPWGTLPTLELEQGVIGQSGAMLRFVGKKTNLYPKDDFEAAQVDDLIGGFDDLVIALRPAIVEQDPAKKKEYQTAALGDMKNYLEKIERFLQQNKSSKFCVGSGPTIADLKIFTFINAAPAFPWIPTDYFTSYTRINEVYQAVGQLQKIKDYYASRQEAK